MSRPSFTARTVAVARGKIAAERRTVPTGDADAEARMYGELGGGRYEATGNAWVAHMRPRTLFVDDAVLDAIDRGVTQIVIVGAGYDGRAVRFATPGVRFFEVDRAETQADKRDRVARAGGHGGEYVVFDVVDGGLPVLLAPAGYDASRPSLFICEGLFPYLTRESIEALLDDLLALCAPEGSRVVLTTAEPSADGPTLAARLWGEWLRRSVALIGEPWKSRFEHGETAQMLVRRGWRIVRENADGTRGYVSIKYEIAPGPQSRDISSVFVTHRMELDPVHEGVLVNRSRVRGALAERLAVGLAGSPDIRLGDRGERDKLDGVDFDHP